MSCSWERERLWLYLLALGFDPHEHRKDAELGRNMFDKPNSRAFSIIAHFLFIKLDKDRAQKIIGSSKFAIGTNFQVRKECCKWLKQITTQEDCNLPNFTPSSLIAPSGDKFVHLLYHFARHVMIEDMKKLSVGTTIPFAEAVMLTPKDMCMAKARHRVANNKMLQVLQKEIYINQEYKKKAHILMTEIDQMISQCVVLQIQSQWMKQNYQKKRNTPERIQKIRSMWVLTVEELTSLTKDKEVVYSVLEDCVHHCILDGTDVVLHVPRSLADRVESGKQDLFKGNIYEGGKLDFLAVVQLLNEALRMLRDECCWSELKELDRIENIVTSCHKALQDLKTKRLQKKQQNGVSLRECISRNQKAWEMKWKTFLGQCPFNSISKENIKFSSTASLLQSPKLPEEDEDSVFQKRSGICDSLHNDHDEKDEEALTTVMDKSSPPPKCLFLLPSRMSSVPSKLSEVSENGDLLTENNLHTETCERNKKLVPEKILKNGKEEFPISEVRENAGEDVIHTKSSVEKDFIKEARDELAEEVAKAVMSELPHSDEEKGMPLEDIISSLCVNPFITKKQIPRTPENILSEIRREKAVQIERPSDRQLSSTEVVTEEAPMSARTIMQEVIDSTFLCSVAVPPLSGSESPLSEEMFQLSSAKSSSQDLGGISHTLELLESSDSKRYGMQETDRSEAQELDCTASGRSSVDILNEASPYRSMNTPDTCLENTSRKNLLPSDHCQNFLMDRMPRWNIYSQLSSFSHETAYVNLWDETLPESDSMDLSTPTGLDFDLNIMGSADTADVSENNRDIEKSDLDLQSLSNSREVPKKTISESGGEPHQTHKGGESESFKSDQSLALALEEFEIREFWCPEFFSKDTFIKTPLSKSNERKCPPSSSLIPHEQLEEMASSVYEIPLDLHKLKDKNS